jgi:hypothetical protein
MISHRRAVQLGLFAAGAVLVASMGVLLMQNKDSGNAGTGAPPKLTTFDPAAAQSAGVPNLLSASSQIPSDVQR